MRTLRQLLARTLLAPFLLLPLLSCGYPKPSPTAVREALERSSTFVEPKTILVARRIEARLDPSYGVGALDDRQLSRLDPVLAVLHANKLVDIQDVYGPDAQSGGYYHVLNVTPAADAPADLFVDASDETMGTPFSPAARTAGWRISLGQRKVIKVWQIIDSNSPMAERLSPGYVLASFDFRWIPSEAGKLFDQASLTFDELPTEQQRAIIWAGDLDSRRDFSARAWLTRGSDGAWKVTLFDCRRCSTQS